MTLDAERRKKRGRSLRSRYRTGGALPAPVYNHFEGQDGPWETGHMTTDITIREATAVELKATVERFVRAVPTVKNLKDPEKAMVAALVLAYDLQPMHINVLEFGGRGAKAYSLYLNYDGRLFCATKSMGARFGGVESRPMSAEEKTLWDIPEGEVGAVASVYQMVGNQRVIRATDIGRAGGQKDTNNPIARSNRQEMALKRAEARALRKAAPLGVDIGTMTDSNDYDDVIEGEATFIDAEPGKQAEISEATSEETAPAEEFDVLSGIDPEFEPMADNVKLTIEQLQEIVAAIDETGISRADAKATGLEIVDLRHAGYSAGQISGFVYQVWAETQPPTKAKGQEDLPW